MSQELNDFHKQTVKFDISKLKQACDKILKDKGFDTSLGIPHFASISLNQIPGDPDSIKGNKTRGVYWTKPDSTGKEVSRDVGIDESKYTEFVKDYKNTYFEEVYNTLKEKYKLGRVRLLLKEPRSTLSWHRDPEPRLHIPIYTNPGSIMVIDKIAHHMPADGSVWITNNLKYHNAFNGGEENRVHLVACVLDYKFNQFQFIYLVKLTKIFIASDHAGYKLKKSVISKFYKKKRIIDLGPKTINSVDYPDFAKKLTKKIASNKGSFGILICGSGMGMAMAANKRKNIRAALCYSLKNTKLSRLHNNANIITLGQRLINKNKAINLIKVFLSTKFEGGRHLRRIKKIQLCLVKANI